MFHTKTVEKMKTQFMFHSFFFRKSFCLLDNVEKYGRAGGVTDGNIICRMCITRWVIKATNTQSEYVTLIAVSRQ
jgi:hypothetical protein